ncbi:Nucleotidyltransferase domain-containing protein [Gammaproteobacteria bacterium]
MRLTPKEIELIKKAFHEIMGDGRIYLFGSRVDDTKRGGDIDLYLCPRECTDNMHQKKIKFLVKLDEYLGEQKIDVVIARDQTRLIEQEALRTGLEL